MMRIGIESGVLEEALVLRGDDGLHQDRRDVAEFHASAASRGWAREIRDELRLELILRPRRCCPAGRRSARSCPSVNLMTPGFLVEVGIRAGEDLDGVRLDRVIPDLIAVRFRVPAAAQLRGDIRGSHGFADRDGVRRGEKSWRNWRTVPAFSFSSKMRAYLRSSK